MNVMEHLYLSPLIFPLKYIKYFHQQHLLKSNRLNKKEKDKEKESGQTLVEFLLLFAIVFTFSMTIMRVSNKNLGGFWVALVNTIVDPDGVSKVELR